MGLFQHHLSFGALPKMPACLLWPGLVPRISAMPSATSSTRCISIVWWRNAVPSSAPWMEPSNTPSEYRLQHTRCRTRDALLNNPVPEQEHGQSRGQQCGHPHASCANALSQNLCRTLSSLVIITTNVFNL